jgi:hypothetical protein
MYWRVPWQDAWPHSLLYPGRTPPIREAVILSDQYLYLSFMGRLTESFPTTAARAASYLPFLHGCRSGQRGMAALWGQRFSTNKST